MRRARVTRGIVASHDALILENDHLRAVVLPGLGGRVWTLEDRLRERQWVWHRETVVLEACAPGSSYDDVWAGGWEELFPNDAACVFEGRDLPDHGEWWTMAWHADHGVDDAGVTATLTATAKVVNAVCTKVFTLAHDAAELTVAYRIRSLEPAVFHFLFKQHLPVQITPSCRLVLPGGQVEAVDPAFGTLMQGAAPFDWPAAAQAQSSSTDLRIIPPATSGTREFVYVKDLPESWCGVDDPDHGASIRLHVDGATLPFTWLFLSYGGWRETYVAVLEPCTNCPKDLTEAVRLGQSASLAPGAEFATTVTVRLAGLIGATP